MIAIWLLLLMFGGGAALLGLLVFAIASKKLWIIPVAGGLVFLGLIASGLLASLFVTASHRSATVQLPSSSEFVEQVGMVTHTVTQGPPNFNAYNNGVNGSVFVSGPHWSRILIFVLLIAFVIGIVVRRGISPAAGHGLRRAWPVVAVILFIAFMFLGTVRTQYTVSQSSNAAASAAARQAAVEMAAQHRAVIAAQKHVADQVRMQQQLVQSDIHAEMDQFDAPHIPLRPDKTSPKAPDAPVASAAPAAPTQPAAAAKPNNKPVEKTNKGETTKTPAASTHKRKKSDKSPATGDTKQAQSVARSKSTAEAIAKKEDTTPSDKLAMVAEAEPEKSKARPDWVDESPKRTGNTRREVIATEEYATVDECYQAADIYLLLKTYQHMQQLAGQPYTDGGLPSLTFQNGIVTADGNVISYRRGDSYWSDHRLRDLSKMGINADYVRREIVAKDPKNNDSREFLETVERTFGPMKKLYLQIEFTPAVDHELRRHWDAHEREDRFAKVGVGSLSVLGLLGVIFALLKIDTATKGYYTKRLFIGVPAVIIGGLLLLMSKTIIDVIK